METNKVHFKFVSQIKDDANAHHMQYQSLCVAVLILFQLRSHFLMLLSFFFPIQMLNGRDEVYFYMQFT